MNSLPCHLGEKHGQNQIRIVSILSVKTFSRAEHYRRHFRKQHNQTLKSPSYPCPVCPNKTFKCKDHLQLHLQSCPTLQKVVNQSEASATRAYFLLEDSAPSEASAEALFLSSIDQGEPFATEAYFPLEDSAPSEPFVIETYFLLEDSAPCEVSATQAYFPLEEALFLSSIDQGEPFATEAYFPLEDIDQGEPFATEALFPLEDIDQGEPFTTEALFPLEDID